MHAALRPIALALAPGLTVLATWLLACPRDARASTLPAAELTEGARLGVGFGTGVSVSLDASVAPLWQVGVALRSSSLEFWGAQGLLVRGGYLLPVRWQKLRVAILAETGWGWVEGPTGSGYATDHLDAGLGFEWPILDPLTARLNLAGRILGARQTNLLSGTLSGVELAWRFTRHAEVTFGSNGFGNVVGLKLGL